MGLYRIGRTPKNKLMPVLSQGSTDSTVGDCNHPRCCETCSKRFFGLSHLIFHWWLSRVHKSIMLEAVWCPVLLGDRCSMECHLHIDLCRLGEKVAAALGDSLKSPDILSLGCRNYLNPAFSIAPFSSREFAGFLAFSMVGFRKRTRPSQMNGVQWFSWHIQLNHRIFGTDQVLPWSKQH